MKTILRQSFRDDEIVIDNQTAYVNCSFTKCHFFYSGGDFQFVNCKMDAPTVTFTGDAGKTLAFMHMMGMMPQGQPPIPPAMSQQQDSGAAH